MISTHKVFPRVVRKMSMEEQTSKCLRTVSEFSLVWGSNKA